jgi:hypothetical protein
MPAVWAKLCTSINDRYKSHEFAKLFGGERGLWICLVLCGSGVPVQMFTHLSCMNGLSLIGLLID